MAPYIPIDYAEQKELNFLDTSGGDMMGKSRNVSKVSSNGFIADYRGAVESVAESEGFASSGRINSEFINMQDSCGPSKQCYSFHADGRDGSAVPSQLFSLSSMSSLERKNLEMKLVVELESIRKFQKKISSYNMDPLMWPSADALHHPDGRKRPLDMEGLQMNNISLPVGKKKSLPARNGARSKVGAVSARRNELVKQGLQQTGNFDWLMKQCGALLSRLWTQDGPGFFKKPVDIVELNIPDYFNFIKHPMDLGTIKKKLRLNQYSNPLEFASDVRLTFNNAMTYNPKGHIVHVTADAMSKSFEVGWKAIEKKIAPTADESTTSMAGVIVEPGNAMKQKLSSLETDIKRGDKHVMSDEEKHRLSSELDALLDELPENIINFLKESTLGCSQETEDELEIDLDNLSDGILNTLRRLIDSYLLEKQKRNLTAEQSKPEHMQNRREGWSNKDMPAEEEVDVVGNDPPPVSSSPPENDEKDGVQGVGGGGCLSKSSSSESSSSSSGSQSSASEQDGVKSSIPRNASNEIRDNRVRPSERNTDLLNENTEAANSLSNSSVEHNCCQEGENAPPERQVSPEKLYRAALLRGRFADIIIKAQENNIEKGNRPDPEKLKLEREELERRRKEEKARLQAEAKAAEDARRKAELEAAAEAKRKRELEREAARQALQQMEKTVDINEGSQFIEDFDMLGSAPDEQLQNLIAELDPKDNENDLLGSFKFQGNSNPLEQLGLYMKNDDEDEEEVEPQSILDTSNDPEEGEID